MTTKQENPFAVTVPIFLHAQRGPNCLFVTLANDASGELCGQNGLFDSIADIMRKHFASRVVIDVDQLQTVPANICDEMDRLSHWIAERDGMIRFAGQSDAFVREMHARHPELYIFGSREHALLGRRAK